MPFPLAAVLGPAAISAGGSILSSLLNKPSGDEEALIRGTVEEQGTKNEILQMRAEMLDAMMGRTEDFKKAILNKKGQPLVMRLPGVGGVSDEQWAKSLKTAIGAIDFGGQREWNAEMQLLGQMNPLGAASGAAAGLGASMQQQRAGSMAGTAGFLSDLGQSIYSGLSGGTPQISAAPQLSPSIAPVAAPSLLDGMMPPTLGSMGGEMPIPAGVNLLPTGPSLEGGF